MAGYSGTPLAQKLGIKPGGSVCVQNAPAHYRRLLEPIPAGVTFAAVFSSTVDVLHLFAKSRDVLALSIKDAVKKTRPDAAIWVSWPKKASKVQTDITEDIIRQVALPTGLVDIKVCAVDQTWSGLKLVMRVELRPKRA